MMSSGGNARLQPGNLCRCAMSYSHAGAWRSQFASRIVHRKRRRTRPPFLLFSQTRQRVKTRGRWMPLCLCRNLYPNLHGKPGLRVRVAVKGSSKGALKCWKQGIPTMTQPFGHEKMIVYQKGMRFVALRSALLDGMNLPLQLYDRLPTVLPRWSVAFPGDGTAILNPFDCRQSFP